MKKTICIFIAVLTFLSLTACGKEIDEQATGSDRKMSNSSVSQSQFKENESEHYPIDSESKQNTVSIDVDLTKLSSTMVYSEVYNMMVSPDSYIGKTVKMNGAFSYYKDPETNVQYFACVIADATACCSQGLEFVLSGNYTYPDDYPKLNSEITVIGTFEVYEENGFNFCRLVDAEFAS